MTWGIEKSCINNEPERRGSNGDNNNNHLRNASCMPYMLNIVLNTLDIHIHIFMYVHVCEYMHIYIHALNDDISVIIQPHI